MMTNEEFEKVKAAVQRALVVGCHWECCWFGANSTDDANEVADAQCIGAEETSLTEDDGSKIDHCLAHAGLADGAEERPGGPFKPGERVIVISEDTSYGEKCPVGTELFVSEYQEPVFGGCTVCSRDGHRYNFAIDTKCLARVSNQPCEPQWPTVDPFRDRMKRELSANAHKGGWGKMTQEQLVLELGHHVVKLSDASTREEVDEYTADVANIAMMIAENFGTLGKQPRERLYTAAEVREIAERAALISSRIGLVLGLNYERIDEHRVPDFIRETAPNLSSVEEKLDSGDELIAARAVALAMPKAKEGEEKQP